MDDEITPEERLARMAEPRSEKRRPKAAWKRAEAMMNDRSRDQPEGEHDFQPQHLQQKTLHHTQSKAASSMAAAIQEAEREQERKRRVKQEAALAKLKPWERQAAERKMRQEAKAAAGAPGSPGSSSPMRGTGGSELGTPMEATDGASRTHRLDTSKMTKKDIRAILRTDDGSGVGAKGLADQLQGSIRGALKRAKADHDTVQNEVAEKERRVEELSARLASLEGDADALGFDEFPEAERLEPVKEISTKPVFIKRSAIGDLVGVLDRERQAIATVERTELTYIFMRSRLESEVVDAKKRMQDLEQARRDEVAIEKELAKKVLAAQEALGNARARLSKLKQDIKEEKKLWLTEIRDRAHFNSQRKGFETFLERQLDRQRELEVKEKRRREARAKDKSRRENMARLFQSRAIAQKLSATVEGAESEEARYEAAFRRLGLSNLQSNRPSTGSGDGRAQTAGTLETAATGGSLDSGRAALMRGDTSAAYRSIAINLHGMDLEPQAVIEACIRQDQVRRELTARQEEEEHRVSDLQRKLAAATQALQDAEAGHAQRGAHRELAEREVQLAGRQQEIGKLAAQIESLRDPVESVRSGFSAMAAKLLGRRVELGTPSDVNIVIGEIQQSLQQVMDDTRRLQAKAHPDDLDTSTTFGATALTLQALPQASTRRDASMGEQLEAAAAADTTKQVGPNFLEVDVEAAKGMVLSADNVRVRAQGAASRFPDAQSAILLPAHGGQDLEALGGVHAEPSFATALVASQTGAAPRGSDDQGGADAGRPPSPLALGDTRLSQLSGRRPPEVALGVRGWTGRHLGQSGELLGLQRTRLASAYAADPEVAARAAEQPVGTAVAPRANARPAALPSTLTVGRMMQGRERAVKHAVGGGTNLASQGDMDSASVAGAGRRKPRPGTGGTTASSAQAHSVSAGRPGAGEHQAERVYRPSHVVHPLLHPEARPDKDGQPGSATMGIDPAAVDVAASLRQQLRARGRTGPSASALKMLGISPADASSAENGSQVGAAAEPAAINSSTEVLSLGLVADALAAERRIIEKERALEANNQSAAAAAAAAVAEGTNQGLVASGIGGASQTGGSIAGAPGASVGSVQGPGGGMLMLGGLGALAIDLHSEAADRTAKAGEDDWDDGDNVYSRNDLKRMSRVLRKRAVQQQQQQQPPAA